MFVLEREEVPSMVFAVSLADSPAACRLSSNASLLSKSDRLEVVEDPADFAAVFVAMLLYYNWDHTSQYMLLCASGLTLFTHSTQ